MKLNKKQIDILLEAKEYIISESGKSFKFNMEHWRWVPKYFSDNHTCDTLMCIGGTIEYLTGDEVNTIFPETFNCVVQDIYGVIEEKKLYSDNLFYPLNEIDESDMTPDLRAYRDNVYNKATPAEACRAIDMFIEDPVNFSWLNIGLGK